MAKKPLTSLSDDIASKQIIYDLLVATYSLPGEILDYVRKATNVDDAVEYAKEAKSHADDLLRDLGSSGVPQGRTLSDVRDAMEAFSSEVVALEDLDEDDDEGICGKGYRWDPITQTCVPW